MLPWGREAGQGCPLQGRMLSSAVAPGHVLIPAETPIWSVVSKAGPTSAPSLPVVVARIYPCHNVYSPALGRDGSCGARQAVCIKWRITVEYCSSDA